MTCRDISELAPLHLSGELDAPRGAAFAAHLESCPACARELAGQAELDARLHEIVLAEEIDETAVIQRVRESIAADAGTNTGARLLLWMPRRWVAAAIGAAAVLLVAGLGYRGLLGTQVARVYADAALDHRLEIVEQQPRQWLVDPAQIAALAEQQGVSGAAVLALAPDGYRLGRGKLCFLDGRVVLHLVFSDGRRELSLFLRPRDAAPLPGASVETVNGRSLQKCDVGQEHVASFQTARLTAVVVTDQPADAALQFARLASAAL